MNRLQGTVGYIVVFGVGLLVGVHIAAQPLEAYLREAAALDSHGPAASPNSPAPTRQKVAESGGSGDGRTDVFDLREGPAYITVRYNGTGPLRFKLLNEHGVPVGTSDGPSGLVGGDFLSWKAVTQAQIDTAGRYALEVGSGGDWKITVSQ